MKANGLELKIVKSRVEFPKIQSSIGEFLSENFREDGFLVAYLDYCVVMGYYRGGELILPESVTLQEKFLQRLRLFNEKRELYVWRDGESLKARLRVDGDGDDIDVVDACQVLWGTRSTPVGQFTELNEERGTRLLVPLRDIRVDDKKRRVFIKTRNYIGYHKNCLATYMDCRFLGFDTKSDSLT